MSVSCNLARELEGIVDAMIEADNDPMDIIACCKEAIIVSMMKRRKKDTTPSIKEENDGKTKW
uniref:Uncharacterized protein n=1 Tax=viral metagenome TaxID=1070528 RepID=A0A6M3Y3W1_9ZZZZ